MPEAGSELLFLHSPPVENPRIGESTTVIALTPAAFEWARREGLAVTVVDDHIDRQTVMPDARDYLRWQFDWVRRLDEQSGSSGSIVTSASLLKRPVDSVVLWSRLISAVVAASRPSRLRYMGPGGRGRLPWHNGHLQFWPILGDRPLAADLVRLVGAQDALQNEIEDWLPVPPEAHDARGWRVRWRASTARAIGPWRHVRCQDARTRRPACLMLWHSGYGAKSYAAEQHALGRRLLFLDRGRSVTRIHDPARPWDRRSVRIDPDLNARHEPQVNAACAEIDRWAGVTGAGDLLTSRLCLLLGAIAPEIANAADALEPVLASSGVVEVAAANPASLEEFAALLATSRLGDVQRTLVQHGDHLFSYDFWLLTETQNFDHLVCSDPTLPSDLLQDAAALNVKAPTFSFESPRHSEIRRSRVLADDGPTVYVPTFLVGDSTQVGGGQFDDAWYHRWHLMLLDLMASRTDKRFVWKGLPSSDQSLDPMPRLIAARGLANVEYRSEPFLRVLPSASRVVIDFPSTALYQAVRARRAVLALVFPRFAQLRATAVELFAPLLRTCADENAALAHLDGFLSDDRRHWVLDDDRTQRLTL
jgi:hypothetical protein